MAATSVVKQLLYLYMNKHIYVKYFIISRKVSLILNVILLYYLFLPNDCNSYGNKQATLIMKEFLK